MKTTNTFGVQIIVRSNKRNKQIALIYARITICYTGLSYIDLVNLTASNICLGMDGEYWIRTSRQKSEIAVKLPILPKAKMLLEKYKCDPVTSNRNQLLPFLFNQKVNAYLKEIARVCGIDKDLSFHLARHTFSTTVTLANGVPLETVSKMLGHTKLTTTQIYVHVLEKKICDDMRSLREKLSMQPNVSKAGNAS